MKQQQDNQETWQQKGYPDSKFLTYEDPLLEI